MAFKKNRLLGIAFAVLWAGSEALAGQAETINCIAAVVNGRVITLMDIRVAESFGLIDPGPAADDRDRRRAILERLIDQKIVIEFARERTPLEAGRVDAARNAVMARLGREEARRRTAEFGLDGADLLPYLEEKVLSETIVSDRFSQSVSVSLKEIEEYYGESYAPAQRKLGAEPKPLVEVLDVLEAEIKRAKVAVQAATWIKNLRQQAEIEIRPDCLLK